MFLFALNSTVLLRLSPYLAVGFVLLLAILVVFRQFVPGKGHAGSGCCDSDKNVDQAGTVNGAHHNAKTPERQDRPLCGSCKGCRVKDCPGLSSASGKE